MRKIAAVLALVLFIGCGNRKVAAGPIPPAPFHVVSAGSEGIPPDLLRLLIGQESDAKTKTLDVKCPTGPGHCVVQYRFHGPILDDSVAQFAAFMQAAEDAKIETVLIELDTPGGSTEAGYEMSRTIEAAKMRVVCVADGEVESMGFYVFESCNTRVMTKRSTLMAHQPRAIQPQGFVSIRDVQQEADSLMATSRTYGEQVIRRMHGITIEQYLAKVDNREWYLGWKEAQAIGAVDRVYSGTPTMIYHDLVNGKPL